MYFSVFRSGTQYRWHLVADNNKIIANSGEAYHNKTDCLHSIGLVKATNTFTPVYDQTAAAVR